MGGKHPERKRSFSIDEPGSEGQLLFFFKGEGELHTIQRGGRGETKNS